MNLSKTIAVCVMCVLGLSLVASASQNQFGVADSHNLQILEPTWVGGVLLPAGSYKVLHTMEGRDHIMVFKQVQTHKPAEVRVKCQLVSLTKKADRDQQTFTMNAANQRVLHTLIFEGDKAQHVF